MQTGRHDVRRMWPKRLCAYSNNPMRSNNFMTGVHVVKQLHAACAGLPGFQVADQAGNLGWRHPCPERHARRHRWRRGQCRSSDGRQIQCRAGADGTSGVVAVAAMDSRHHVTMSDHERVLGSSSHGDQRRFLRDDLQPRGVMTRYRRGDPALTLEDHPACHKPWSFVIPAGNAHISLLSQRSIVASCMVLRSQSGTSGRQRAARVRPRSSQPSREPVQSRAKAPTTP